MRGLGPAGTAAALALLALAACGPQGDPARPWPLRAYCAARDWVEREDFRVRGERRAPDPCAPHLSPGELLDPRGDQREGSESLAE